MLGGCLRLHGAYTLARTPSRTGLSAHTVARQARVFTKFSSVGACSTRTENKQMMHEFCKQSQRVSRERITRWTISLSISLHFCCSGQVIVFSTKSFCFACQDLTLTQFLLYFVLVYCWFSLDSLFTLVDLFFFFVGLSMAFCLYLFSFLNCVSCNLIRVSLFCFKRRSCIHLGSLLFYFV